MADNPARARAAHRLLPRQEAYLDAFRRFLFLRAEHLRHLFGEHLNSRTLRWDLARLINSGYLSRTRNSKDEEYTYFPAAIREKSSLTLEHTNEITWAHVLFATDPRFESVACERRSRRIRFQVSINKDDGTVKTRRCTPDFLSAYRRVVVSTASVRCFFWEIKRAKPGQHWRKENDI